MHGWQSELMDQKMVEALSLSRSLSLFFCDLLIYLSIHYSPMQLACRFTFLHIYLATYLSSYLFVCLILFVCLYVCLTIYLTSCLGMSSGTSGWSRTSRAQVFGFQTDELSENLHPEVHKRKHWCPLWPVCPEISLELWPWDHTPSGKIAFPKFQDGPDTTNLFPPISTNIHLTVCYACWTMELSWGVAPVIINVWLGFSLINRFSLINHPFAGTPHLWKRPWGSRTWPKPSSWPVAWLTLPGTAVK